MNVWFKISSLGSELELKLRVVCCGGVGVTGMEAAARCLISWLWLTRIKAMGRPIAVRIRIKRGI